MKIFHLATVDAWHDAQASGAYTVSTLGLDLSEVGFIHCAQPDQVAGVHERFYSDIDPLLVLTIDTELLTSPWQLDDVPGEPSPFPHVYGPLNLDAVVSAEPFRSSASS